MITVLHGGQRSLPPNLLLADPEQAYQWRGWRWTIRLWGLHLFGWKVGTRMTLSGSRR